MENRNDILGMEREMSGPEVVRYLTSLLAEGWQGPEPPTQSLNLFGRQVAYRSDCDLSFLRGFLMAGLRAAARVQAGDLPGNRQVLQTIARENLPAVLHLFSPETETVSRPEGWFQLVATDPTEALWMSLLAHRVAETALVPGILIHEYPAERTQKVSWPTAATLRTFSGSPDERIPVSTPAQEMIFGPQRRRIPHWYHIDNPVWMGLPKTKYPRHLEWAARNAYFFAHLPVILENVFQSLSEASQREWAAVSAYQAEKADHLLISTSGTTQAAVQAVREKHKARVGSLQLKLLHPFPETEVRPWLNRKKTITVLDRPDPAGGQPGSSYLQQQIQVCLPSGSKASPHLFAGLYHQSPESDLLQLALENALKGGRNLDRYYLDLAFTGTAESPIRRVFLEEIEQRYPQLADASLLPPATEESHSFRPPLSVQQYADHGAPYTHLSRFFHQTASVYNPENPNHLPADPFQGLPLAPPASATLARPPVDRDQLPVFLPQNCTGCGECLVACPETALPSLALRPDELLRGGMDIAAKRGRPLTSLAPLVGNLGKLMLQLHAPEANPSHRTGPLAQKAFEELVRMSDISGDKQERLQEEFTDLLEIIGDLPLAAAPAYRNAAGAFFSLVVDPNACTACGRCAEVCPEDALRMEVADVEREQKVRAGFDLWELLPDTSGETMQKMAEVEDLNAFTPLMLSRNFYHALGGAGTEGNPVRRQLHHLICTTAEAVLQARVATQREELRQLIETLSRKIHDMLGEALPSNDFSKLLRTLRKTPDQRLSLEELVGDLSSENTQKLIDSEELRRRITLLDDLRELHRLLTDGPTGVGRARYGLINTETTYQYPYNPFLVPVLQGSEALRAGEISGLWSGHVRHLLDNVRLIRRARLEVKDKYRPKQHAAEIAQLSWETLTDTEKELIPPLLIVTQRRHLSAAAESEWIALLKRNLPIKLFFLEEPGDDLTNWQSVPAIPLVFAGLPGLVFQSAVEMPDHLYRCLREALGNPGPAVGYLLADAHEGAVATRTWPVLRYIPEPNQDFISARLDLSGNPEPDLEAPPEAVLTAFLNQWREHLQRTESETAMPLSEWLQATPDRRREAPVRIGSDDQVASPALTQFLAQNLRQWLQLRELAGQRTPFPDKLEQTVRAEMEEKYRLEHEELRKELEEQWQRKEADFMQEVKTRLRDKLVHLSGQRHKDK